MNALADGLILLNADGKIEFVNQAFEKITGYKKNEVVGKNSKDLNSIFNDRLCNHEKTCKQFWV